MVTARGVGQDYQMFKEARATWVIKMNCTLFVQIVEQRFNSLHLRGICMEGGLSARPYIVPSVKRLLKSLKKKAMNLCNGVTVNHPITKARGL